MKTDSDIFNIFTGRDNYELVNKAAERISPEWPQFMLHDPVADYLDDCYEKLPDFQFVITGEDTNEPLAIGNSIPIFWDKPVEGLPEEGWDWALTKGIEYYNSKREATCLCALQIVVFNEFRGMGISSKMVEAMKDIGRKYNLTRLIAPVRPNRKSNYPLTDIGNYIKWTNEEGLPFDPWLRVHQRLGAKIIKPCRKAMNISGTISDWESWTGLHFPVSGQYIVSGALVPVEINVANNIGRYIEPNVWMEHIL